MKNKEILIKKLEGSGYELGCYDADMDKVPKKGLFKIFDKMFEGWTDVEVFIRRKSYIVEIATVDNEIDFNILSKDEYDARYNSGMIIE